MKSAVSNIGGGSSGAATEALAQTEQRITELQAAREQKLIDAEGDYLAEIAGLDEQIRTMQANAIVHRDRSTAMKTKEARREQKRLADERTAFVAEIKKTIPRRHAATVRLDAALKEAALAFEELAAADDAIFANWPEVMPPAPRYSYLRALRIDGLSSTRKHRVMSAGFVRELVNRGPFDFATEVEKRGRELIDELEGAPAHSEVAA